MKKRILLLLVATFSLTAGEYRLTTKCPTIASAKSASMFDLVTDVTDAEALMLDNARRDKDVLATVNVLLRIHTKRFPELESVEERRQCRFCMDLYLEWQSRLEEQAAKKHKKGK